MAAGNFVVQVIESVSLFVEFIRVSLMIQTSHFIIKFKSYGPSIYSKECRTASKSTSVCQRCVFVHACARRRVCVCVCARARARASACVCVCERERDRQTDRQTDRLAGRLTTQETQTDTEKHNYLVIRNIRTININKKNKKKSFMSK